MLPMLVKIILINSSRWLQPIPAFCDSFSGESIQAEILILSGLFTSIWPSKKYILKYINTWNVLINKIKIIVMKGIQHISKFSSITPRVPARQRIKWTTMRINSSFYETCGTVFYGNIWTAAESIKINKRDFDSVNIFDRILLS